MDSKEYDIHQKIYYIIWWKNVKSNQLLRTRNELNKRFNRKIYTLNTMGRITTKDERVVCVNIYDIWLTAFILLFGSVIAFRASHILFVFVGSVTLSHTRTSIAKSISTE